MTTVACVGSKFDFRRHYGVFNRYYDDDSHTEYICVACDQDYIGKRFDKVFYTCRIDESMFYEKIYNECMARCKQQG